MDFISKLILNHLLAIPIVVGLLAVAVKKLDAIILFLLRFFSKESLEAQLDKLGTEGKREIEKVASQLKD